MSHPRQPDYLGKATRAFNLGDSCYLGTEYKWISESNKNKHPNTREKPIKGEGRRRLSGNYTISH